MRPIATAILLLAGSAAAQKAPVPLADALLANRTALGVRDSGFDGEGATVLRDAMAPASVVAIGEEHGTSEIPLFVSAVCDALGSQISLLALEVGPTAAERLDATLRSPARAAQMAAFSRRYPASAAFLELAADNASAARCLQRAPGARLAGIDQEFIGAGGLLLDEIGRTRLNTRAREAIAGLHAVESRGAGAARASGDPSPLLLLSADPAAVETARTAIAAGGDARARTVFERLAESAAIYRLNAEGVAEANARRARLLKRNLKAAMPATGKVLVKMGSWHLYKGVNPLRQRDLGNWIAEEVEGTGRPPSIHILVVTARGHRAGFAGYARPPKPEGYDTSADPGSAWLAPALAAQVPGRWTVFDLRRLRMTKLTGVSPEWTRAIDGYDLLVVVPVATATGGVGE